MSENYFFKPGMQPDGQLKDLPGGNEKGFLGGEKLAKATGQKLLQALKVLGQPNPNQDVLPKFNDELYY